MVALAVEEMERHRGIDGKNEKWKKEYGRFWRFWEVFVVQVRWGLVELDLNGSGRGWTGSGRE